MLNLNEFLETPMGQGVKLLSEELQARDMPPVTLDCIGGFALLMHDMRDLRSSTDIDYVGRSLGDDFDRIANEIGEKTGLGKGWINNDGMLTGMTLEDFELSTGKLHFDHAMDVGSITINVLRQPDLLRMKIISIDTSLMAAQDRADKFARSRDMSDIRKLMEAQGLDLDAVDDLYGDYIRSDMTLPAIEKYAEGGLDAVFAMLDEAAAKPQQEPEGLDMQQEAGTELGRMISSGGFSISSMLDMAQARAAGKLPLPDTPEEPDPGTGSPGGPDR